MTDQTSTQNLYNDDKPPLSTRTLLLVRGNSRYQGQTCPACGDSEVRLVDVNDNNKYVVAHNTDATESTCTFAPESSDFEWPWACDRTNA